MDAKNNFPGSIAAYCSDGAGIVIGSLMGTSPITVFVGEPPARPRVQDLHNLVRHVNFKAFLNSLMDTNSDKTSAQHLLCWKGLCHIGAWVRLV